MLFLDTETCGLSGPCVTIQWKEPGNDPHIHHIWKEPIESTLWVIRKILEHDVCCWNLPFDWFHINKIYNYLVKHPDQRKPPDYRWVAGNEESWVRSGTHAEWCLKPAGCLDLLLHCRSGPLQTLMMPKKEGGQDIRIKLVPTSAVNDLIERLPKPGEPFDPIYFYRRTNPGWQVLDTDRSEFKDLILRFAPSMGLKPVYEHIFNKPTIDYPIPKTLLWDENEWCPWGGAWPTYLPAHVAFWHNDPRAGRYAANDVIYLEELWNHFKQPDPNDVNSELAISVGCARWRGLEVDHDKLNHELKNLELVASMAPQSPREAKAYILGKARNPVLKEIKLPDTAKRTLERFIESEEANETQASRSRCAEAARQVLNARRATKRIEVLKKLRQSIRFFPSFTVIGTKSDRMAGSGGLNPQGIPHEKRFRSIFPFCSRPDSLSGGDYSGFEVTIADAVYNDGQLHADLRSGKKIHGLLGAELYGESYENILASQGQVNYPAGNNKYNPAKNAVFATLYGAREFQIAQTAHISEEDAKRALSNFEQKYPGIGRARREIAERFCSITQPGGKGTKVVWSDPASYVESLLGFKRYYTVENVLVKEIFNVAESVPIDWNTGATVRRRDKEQSVSNACRSALYSTCFTIQQRNLRTAANHQIQATGAGICKALQRDLWRLQRVGCHRWAIQLFNVHDELMCVHQPELKDRIQEVIDNHVEEYRKVVPLLEIEWKWDLTSWGAK